MKKIGYFLFLIVLSCSNNPGNYIDHLNGYWEIDEVIMPDGSLRDYNFNDTIDYLSITDSLTGIRKKLKPNIDGTFATSDDTESLKLVIENDSLYIYYTTPFSKWKETVLKASKNELIIKSQNNTRYVYKRYEPLELE